MTGTPISSLSRLVSYRAEPETGLYRGRTGEWAVADADGPATVTILAGPGRIETESGTVAGPRASFEGWAVVWSSGRETVEAEVRWGSEPRLAGPGVAWEGGCGWASVEGSGAIVDDAPHLPGSIVPVFRSVSGPARFWPVAGVECVQCDSFEPTDPEAGRPRGWDAQNATDALELASLDAAGNPLTATHLSHLNAASWSVEVPAWNLGLRVRKLYDRFHGMQRARLLVDDTFAGWWYEPGRDRVRRWAWSEVGVPAALTQGRERVRLTVDPPAGTALWSVARLEVWALVPAGSGRTGWTSSDRPR